MRKEREGKEEKMCKFLENANGNSGRRREKRGKRVMEERRGEKTLKEREKRERGREERKE